MAAKDITKLSDDELREQDRRARLRALPDDVLEKPNIAADVAKSGAQGLLITGPKSLGNVAMQGATSLIGPAGIPIRMAADWWNRYLDKKLPDYQPKTKAGEYAKEGASGVAAGLPFGPMGVLSAVSSGLGGQLGGDLFGPVGKVAGAFLGGVAPNVPGMMFRNSSRIVQDATKGMTPDEWAAAIERQKNANKLGVLATGPEALNNKALLSTQLMVEQHPQSSLPMSRFMSKRSGQVQRAATAELDKMGNLPLDARILGNAVSGTADDALNAARQGANTLSRPAYDASVNTKFPFGSIGYQEPKIPVELRQNRIYQEAAAAVRSSPTYGLPKNEPTFSPRTMDAAKKWINDQISTAQRSGEPAKAALYQQALSKLTQYADEMFPDYAVARIVNQKGREMFLEPRLQSLTGALSETKNPTQQFAALADPQLSNPAAIKQVAGDIARRNPAQYSESVRLGLQNELDSAFKNLQGSGQEFAGARFARSMRETPKTAANIKAIIEQLPDGKTKVQAFEKLLDVLETTGNRLPVGSRTAFNELSKSNMTAQGIGALLSNPTQPAARWIDRVSANFTADNLQKIFTDPDSVEKLRQLTKVAPQSAQARALVYSLLGGNQAVDEVTGH